MKAHQLLILKASDDVEICETTLIERVADMYGMTVEVHELRSAKDLDDLAPASGAWDIVYACGHGNADGIGEPVGGRFFRWGDVSEAICEHLSDDAWFFLACCRGGLQRVAYALFCGCGDLGYVFGPRWEADPRQLACAFHTLVHNFVDEEVEPARAAKRASRAIELKIRAFDREEVESSDAFVQWCTTNGELLFGTSIEPPDEVTKAFAALGDPTSRPEPESSAFESERQMQ